MNDLSIKDAGRIARGAEAARARLDKNTQRAYRMSDGLCLRHVFRQFDGSMNVPAAHIRAWRIGAPWARLIEAIGAIGDTFHAQHGVTIGDAPGSFRREYDGFLALCEGVERAIWCVNPAPAIPGGGLDLDLCLIILSRIMHGAGLPGEAARISENRNRPALRERNANFPAEAPPLGAYEKTDTTTTEGTDS